MSPQELLFECAALCDVLTGADGPHGPSGRVTAHLHHSAASTFIGRVVAWPLQRLYDGGDDYPCISRAIEQETLAVGVPRNHVHYLPNPVDTTRFSPADAATRAALRQAAGIAADARVAVIVGRLSREKGQLQALRAWQRCAIDRGLLVLVGPDMTGHPWDIGPAARAFVQQQGMADRVRFVGGVPASDVINWLRLADVAVQPSEFEAFGTAAIEAMAAGLPVVASDVGGLRDFVLPGINGFRVPPDQPDALADALSRVMNDDGLRGTLAAGALRTVPEFDVATVLGRLAMLLDAAVARRRNG